MNPVTTTKPIVTSTNNVEIKSSKKMATVTKVSKAATMTDPSKMQLILRPIYAVVLYTPLWKQVQTWAINKAAEEQEKRGRSVSKNTKVRYIIIF